jgi:hypothetical protein
MAIHKQRGGRYRYYWPIIIGGVVFVIAFCADGVGLGG